MTDITSQIILTSLTMLLLVHNGRVAHHMGKRIFKDLRDKASKGSEAKES